MARVEEVECYKAHTRKSNTLWPCFSLMSSTKMICQMSSTLKMKSKPSGAKVVKEEMKDRLVIFWRPCPAIAQLSVLADRWIDTMPKKIRRSPTLIPTSNVVDLLSKRKG